MRFKRWHVVEWPWLHKGIFVLMVSVLVGGLGYGVEYQRQQMVLLQWQTKQKALLDWIAKSQTQVRLLETKKQRTAQVKRALEAQGCQVPFASEPEGLAQLTSYALQGGLLVKSLKRHSTPPKKQDLVFSEVTLVLEGSYPIFAQWIGHLAALRNVRLQDFVIRREANRVTMKITLSFFLRSLECGPPPPLPAFVGLKEQLRDPFVRERYAGKGILIKEPLERLRVVGILRKEQKKWALVVGSEGVVEKVMEGSVIGQQKGYVVRVTEEGILVRGEGGEHVHKSLLRMAFPR